MKLPGRRRGNGRRLSDLVVYTQPYVPAYRVPLFDALDRRLGAAGLRLEVHSGEPAGEQAERGDASTGSWHRRLSIRRINVLRWSIEFRALPRRSRRPAVLVSELAALNVLAWRYYFSRTPMILWGHGKSYVNTSPRIADFIESLLVRRADHVMTYSESGRLHVIETSGKSPSLVTAIGNSTDTTSLRRHFLEVFEARPERRSHSALYVGGLDETKRIDFLLEAYRSARSIDPAFTLIVVGKGPAARSVQEIAAHDEHLHYIAEARGRRLAEVGAAADVLWNPGRVGLVAVDALAMGLPVHTTRYPYHAPEIEFLRSGEVEHLSDEPSAFAAESLEAASRSEGRVLREDIPSVESVADEMTQVIAAAMSRWRNDRG